MVAPNVRRLGAIGRVGEANPQRLAVMFATERAELETRWAGGNQVSTEDLRQGLRRYRSFFERLLAA